MACPNEEEEPSRARDAPCWEKCSRERIPPTLFNILPSFGEYIFEQRTQRSAGCGCGWLLLRRNCAAPELPPLYARAAPSRQRPPPVAYSGPWPPPPPSRGRSLPLMLSELLPESALARLIGLAERVSQASQKCPPRALGGPGHCCS